MTTHNSLNPLPTASQHISDPEQRTVLFGQQNPALTNLAVAENVLIFDLFEDILQDSKCFGVTDTKYPQPFYGDASVVKMTANFLSETFQHELNPGHLSGVSGVTAALECLAFALFSPGDTVLVPTPCWQGFNWCFEGRPRMKIIPVDLYSRNNFELTVRAVQDVYSRTNPKPKALVLTNPHNPLGINYDKRLLEKLYTWALNGTEMHIISDEIYCHSQIGIPGSEFVSAFALDAYQGRADRVHVVWGFAKDFGVSGFMAGFVITANGEVHNRIRNDRYGRFSPFDSLKNFVLKKLLSGTRELLPRLAMVEYQKRLTDVYNQMTTLFESVPDIKPHPLTRAAQFFWLDMRAYLDRVPASESFSSLTAIDLLDYPESHESETRLLKYIAEKGGVQLLPGQTLSCREPGFFRLCFTCEQTPTVRAAIKRMIVALEALKP